jgi:hypothetical protein
MIYWAHLRSIYRKIIIIIIVYLPIPDLMTGLVFDKRLRYLYEMSYSSGEKHKRKTKNHYRRFGCREQLVEKS